MMLFTIPEKALQNIAQQFGVKLLYVFGSQVTGNATAESDVDIAYQSTRSLSLEHRASLISCLEKILNITDADIDLVDMNTAPPLLAYQIVKNGKKIFGSNSSDDAFYRHAIKSYFDAEPLFLATKQYIYAQLHLSGA